MSAKKSKGFTDEERAAMRVEKSLHLRFRVESCNVPEPYGIRWEVRNHGLEAEQNNDLYHDDGVLQRGQSGFDTHTEGTNYRGSHYLDCVIIKTGTAVCRARHVVNTL